MKSKRGGVRKKGKKNSKNWKDPYASLNPDKSMARRIDDVNDIQEYVHLLSEKDKLWMAKFMREYNNASLDFQNLEKKLVLIETTTETAVSTQSKKLKEC
jgi:hypothetical protein